MARILTRLMVVTLAALTLTACSPDESTRATTFLSSAMDAAQSYRQSHGTFPRTASALNTPTWDGTHTVTALTGPRGDALCLELRTARGAYSVYSSAPETIYKHATC